MHSLEHEKENPRGKEKTKQPERRKEILSSLRRSFGKRKKASAAPKKDEGERKETDKGIREWSFIKKMTAVPNCPRIERSCIRGSTGSAKWQASSNWVTDLERKKTQKEHKCKC